MNRGCCWNYVAVGCCWNRLAPVPPFCLQGLILSSAVVFRGQHPSRYPRSQKAVSSPLQINSNYDLHSRQAIQQNLPEKCGFQSTMLSQHSGTPNGSPSHRDLSGRLALLVPNFWVCPTFHLKFHIRTQFLRLCCSFSLI